MFELGIEPKENFLTYSTQFVFFTIRLVPETWSWTPLTCAERAPSRGSGYIELRANMCILIISILFIVDTNSVLKLVFPIVVSVLIVA